ERRPLRARQRKVDGGHSRATAIVEYSLAAQIVDADAPHGALDLIPIEISPLVYVHAIGKTAFQALAREPARVPQAAIVIVIRRPAKADRLVSWWPHSTDEPQPALSNGPFAAAWPGQAASVPGSAP